MFKQLTAIVAMLTLSAGFTLGLTETADELKRTGDLTVHEWGTFTTVAGPDGRAIDWLPLGGPSDLPCFVNYFGDKRSVSVKTLTRGASLALDYKTARAQLRGPVRMETPVLYFYSSRPDHLVERQDFTLRQTGLPTGDHAQPLLPGPGDGRRPPPGAGSL
jgi:hypothetical protein